MLGFSSEQDITITLIEQQAFPEEMTVSLDLKDGKEFAGGIRVKGCGNARKNVYGRKNSICKSRLI